MARIVLFKGQSNYGALCLHTDRLAEAFANLGHQAEIIDVHTAQKNGTLSPLLLNTFSSPCDAVISFNGIGSGFTIKDQSLYNHFNLHYISVYVDHPSFHIPRLNQPITHHTLTFLDISHLVFAQCSLDEKKYESIAFLPPGGSESKQYSLEKNYADYLEKRTIPILFTGSFRGEPQPFWQKNYDKYLQTLVDKTIDYLLNHDCLSVEEIIYDLLCQLKMELSELNQATLIQAIQEYVANARRFLLFQTLGEREIPVVIYGQGWEPWVERWPSFTIHQTGNVYETLDLLHQARIVINSNNQFVHGAHERVFNAMINGCTVVSDSSSYYENELTPNQDIILFNWSSIDTLPDKLMALVDNPEKTWVISQAAHQTAIRHHSWQNRACQLLQLIENHHSKQATPHLGVTAHD